MAKTKVRKRPNSKVQLEKDSARLLELLRERGASKTICPSEILSVQQKQNPARMERVRNAARQLAARNKIVIMQKGKIIDPDNIRGPVRLKLLQPT